jgi:hypothetical protein
MATIFDNPNAYTPAPVQEDEALHNALIKERYRQLQNAEETQLSESISAAHESSYQATQTATQTVDSVRAPERPEQTTYEPYEPIGHTRVESPLFTTEMLEKTLRYNDEHLGASTQPIEKTASETVDVAAAPVQAAMPVSVASTAIQEETYGLSAFAIKMIAAFAAVVVVLLSIIGINSAIIRQKSVRLRELEEQKESLTEESAEMAQRLFAATSVETIMQWAEENGFIQIGD